MIPERLEMRDFQSYDNAVIDFNFDSALIIGERDGNTDISNGAGKCLSGDTVLTSAKDGSRITIKELHESAGSNTEFQLMGLGTDLKTSSVNILSSIYTGKKKCLKITTRNGLQEIVSTTHPIMTGDLVTCEAQDLNVGSVVATPRRFIREKHIDYLSVSEARVLAALIAEGGLTTKDVRFTNADKDIVNTVSSDLLKSFKILLKKQKDRITYNCVSSCDKIRIREKILSELDRIGHPIESIELKNASRCRRLESLVKLEKFEENITLEQFPKLQNLLTEYFSGQYLQRFLSKFNVRTKSINKKLPQELFQASDEVIGAFIGMFWSCDGFVSQVGSRSLEISVGLGSEDLVREIASLLKHKGIYGTVRERINKEGFKSWTYSISTHAPNVLRFINMVDGHIYGPKLNRVKEHKIRALRVTSNANIDVIPSKLIWDHIKRFSGKLSYKELGLNRSRRQIAEHDMSRELCAKYGEVCNIDRLVELGTSDIFWDTIVSIEDVGEKDTYDLEIDNDTHLYALDAFYTHNSAIFEAIGWTLFNKSRQKNADAVVKRTKDECEIDFIFNHDGKRYRVCRKRNSRFSRAEVNFYEFLDDGTEVAVQGDTNKEIDAKIRSVLKTNYDVFLNSCYFRQNTISDFMNGTPATKQKIVSSILNLDRWDKYADKAKDKLGKFNKMADNIRFKLKGTEELETKLLTAKEELDSNRKLAKQLDNKEILLTDEIQQLEIRINNMKLQETSLNDYHDSVSKLDNVNDRVIELEKSIVEKTEERDKLLTNISNNERTVAELEHKIEEISANLELKDRFDLRAMEESFVKGNTKLSVVSDEIERWDGDAICQCCGRSWKEHEDKVAEINKKKINQKAISDKLDKLSSKIDTAKKIANRIKHTEVEIEKYTGRVKSLNNNIEIYKLKLEVAEKELSTFTSAFKEKSKEKEVLEDRIKGMDEIVRSSKYEEVRKLFKSKKTEKQKVVEDKNEIIYTVGGLTQKVKELTKNKEEKDELTAKLSDIDKNITIYSSLVKSFGRTGIQAIIIDNVVEELTKVANEWLNKFCYEPTYIKFITQKQDTKGGWKETLEIQVVTPSGVCDFESLSGGEAFRVAFAIRLGLAQIQARRMGGETQLLLLDEVSTSLDKHGLEMFVSIIRQLEKKMKVMVVTHDDNLKEEFEYIITVKKTGGNSTLSIR